LAEDPAAAKHSERPRATWLPDRAHPPVSSQTIKKHIRI